MRCNWSSVVMVFALVAALMLVPGVSLAQGSSIGVVDMQAVIENHPELADAQAEYQAAFMEIQQELEELTEAEQEAAIPEYQAALQELEQQINQKLEDDVQSAIVQVAESMDLDAVISTEALLYGGIDITDDVVEALGH